MSEFVFGAATALYLGILTSLSPCPLATNIAAISFIGRRVGSPRLVLLSGLLYALGRTVAYVALAILIVGSLLTIPALSYALQKYMNKLLGPLLVLVGMFLLELLQLPSVGGGLSAKMQRRAEAWGVWAAALLGILFALSFCPLSAALFFGSLIPLSVKWNSSVALPSLYGVGTAIPVLAFAVLLSLGARFVGVAFKRVTQVELWARRITGAAFIALGIYYSLAYIFRVFR